MPYRPRVIPTAEDPLAAAITGLREGWRAAAEARRQRQLDEERRQERQFLQDLQRRQQEAREFEVYGQVLLPEPPAERQTAPRPPAAGAYVPGHGFALPRPPIEPSTAGTGSQASPIAPTAVEWADPRYEEFAPGRWGRRDLLPAERAATRARQLEEERIQRLAEALAGLEHIPEASRRAIALGVPPNVAIPPATGETPQRGELIQTDQGWALVNPVTGEAKLLGLDVPPRATEAAGPGRITETQARLRVAYARAAPALEQIERFLGYDPTTGTFAEGGGRVPVESFLGQITPGRFFQSGDVQAYDRAAEAIASAILRVESGAAITQQEIDSYKRQFIPRPGDRPEVIRRKLQALRATLEAIQQAAGIDDGVEVPPAPTNPFR